MFGPNDGQHRERGLECAHNVRLAPRATNLKDSRTPGAVRRTAGRTGAHVPATRDVIVEIISTPSSTAKNARTMGNACLREPMIHNLMLLDERSRFSISPYHLLLCHRAGNTQVQFFEERKRLRADKGMIRLSIRNIGYIAILKSIIHVHVERREPSTIASLSESSSNRFPTKRKSSN